MEKPLSHNDDAEIDDAFEQTAFIEEICRQIKSCSPPKGIAVNGYWGTGKTSTLLKLHFHLTNKLPHQESSNDATTALAYDTNIVPIWFEAWRYQHESAPIVALLHEIRAQLSTLQKMTEQAKKLLSVSMIGSLSVIDSVIKTASAGIAETQLGKIHDIGVAYENAHYQTRLPSKPINQLLQESIQEIIGKDKRLVIFIDDLDRCEPETAYRLLEGIKVYLNLKNCVVVFAMDQRQIERAFAKLAGADNTQAGNNGHFAREYLEKICQDIFYIPLPDCTRKANYLKQLIEQLEIGNSKNTDHMFSADNIVQQAKAFDCLPANPRKIKMLSNRLAYILRRLNKQNNAHFTQSLGTDKNNQLLLTVAILYCFHHCVYEQLEKEPEYILTIIQFGTSDIDTTTRTETSKFKPMEGIIPSISANSELPVNPNDSHVFRLHRLMAEFNNTNSPITPNDIQPFLGL